MKKKIIINEAQAKKILSLTEQNVAPLKGDRPVGGRPDVSSVRPQKPDVSYPYDNPNYIGTTTPILGYDGPPIYDYGNSFMDVSSCQAIYDVPGNSGYQTHYSSAQECTDSRPNSNWCYQPEIVDAMNSRKIKRPKR